MLGTVIAVGGVQLTSNLSIDGTPSQEVLDTLADELPDATGGQGTFVITTEDGSSVIEPERVEVIMDVVESVYATEHVNGSVEEAQQPFIEQFDALTAQAAALPAAEQAAFMAQLQQQADAQIQQQIDDYGFAPLIVDGLPFPPVLISEDERAALFQFALDQQVQPMGAADLEEIIEAGEALDGEAGLTVLPGESLKFPVPALGVGEIVGVLIAAVVLVLALGSLVAGTLPLVTGIVSVGVGVGIAIASAAGEPINLITPILAVMIGLAVGIDYSLFIVNRQRNLIRVQQLPAPEAAGRAVGSAGSSVVFAGLTVIVALVGLAAVGVSMLTAMALVAAGTVAVAVLVALTLLPALLGLVGERVVSVKARATGATAEQHHRIARGWSGFIVRRRWLVLLGTAVIVVLAALPTTGMTLGMPTGGSASPDSSARQSYDAVGESFGAGFNGPLIAVAETGSEFDEEQITGITERISDVDGVRMAQVIGASDDDGTVAFLVIPETGPGDERTAHLVHELRETTVNGSGDEQTLGVTGLTAVMIDMTEKMAEVFPIYIAIIVILSMIILLFAFRSVLLPILATGGFVLSILATLGLTTLVFQDGWLGGLFNVEPGTPLVPVIPIIGTGIMYGLAMDYQVFLSSSMRDHFLRGESPRRAVISGFSATSRVVVAAAIIMASVFAGFIFSPETMIAQIGFTLAVGVLIDAFLVRMTLIPAAFAILGRATWWAPRWLQRILPDLDIEGHKLEQEPATQS
ncbi:MMPL family transporter [Agromyces bauzanensis]|uniref:MMPL family transporter n=1 Tax=Agromyces bauzanensis TaxID=1308924 RepID=UPI00166C2C3E|nr:MMPL family transporter [Agromyces bauzanensis]